ncbi:hypothetical protein GCM10028818_00040 [Spirosoma horti]
MKANSQLNEYKVSLEFETSPTFGVLYRRIRDAMQEREAVLNQSFPLDVALFREVRDLKNMMQLLKSAFEKTIAQWETQTVESGKA